MKKNVKRHAIRNTTVIHEASDLDREQWIIRQRNRLQGLSNKSKSSLIRLKVARASDGLYSLGEISQTCAWQEVKYHLLDPEIADDWNDFIEYLNFNDQPSIDLGIEVALSLNSVIIELYQETDPKEKVEMLKMFLRYQEFTERDVWETLCEKMLKKYNLMWNKLVGKGALVRPVDSWLDRHCGSAVPAIKVFLEEKIVTRTNSGYDWKLSRKTLAEFFDDMDCQKWSDISEYFSVKGESINKKSMSQEISRRRNSEYRQSSDYPRIYILMSKNNI